MVWSEAAKMTRLGKKFSALKKEKRKAFIPFITAGDPNLPKTLSYVRALEAGGADIIELGVPFSDPMADGPVIQQADERALKKNTNLKGILRLVREVRRGSDIPIVLMGYYNPIYRFGLKRFAMAARSVGVDGCLIADLPPDEAAEVTKPFQRIGIDLVYLLAPTSDAERIRKVSRAARGYIYFVSLTGITGGRMGQLRKVRQQVQAIRRVSRLPIAVGFGISKPRQAKEVARFSDGVVVGSAFVKRIGEKASARQIERLTRSFRRALDSS